MKDDKKIIDKAYISLLQGLSLNLSIKLKNNKLGKKRSSAKGSSVEFSDYREYIPGDDYRRIDWNALARFEKLFIKLYMEEQESPMNIYLDTSKSMSLDLKREAAIKTAALFAFTSLADYDSVSLNFFSDKMKPALKNINSKQGFYKLAGILEDEAFGGVSDISASFSTLNHRKKGYSVIITDFLYKIDLDDLFQKFAYGKQKLIICHILSADELKPSFESNIRLKDSENFDEINVDINELTMQIYKENLGKYLNEIQSMASKHGASYFLIDSGEKIEAFIHEIVRKSEGGK